MNKKEALLKAAESKVRSGGYNNFSFREIAAEVGIKSSSVHYHFPTKGDLGAELARQYTDAFVAALGDPNDLVDEGKNPIEVYIDSFRTALVQDKKMCLCGLLGAEIDGLPDKVKYETKRFFENNINWLERAWAAQKRQEKDKAKSRAIQTIALLEGAMLISKSLDSNDAFEKAVSELAN